MRSTPYPSETCVAKLSSYSLLPSLDSVGLELAQELSDRGAHLLIALPEGLTEAKNLQLVLLLRRPGQNESIFLENYATDSAEETVRFAKKYIESAQLPTNTSRLDALIFLPSRRKKQQHAQTFLLLNTLMPYLLAQLQSGPPVRVVDVDSSQENRSLWRTFQRHLGPNPPLILLPSPPSPLDCLWAILTPINLISPGLVHSRRKPLPIQAPLDQSLLDHHLKSVKSIIHSTLENHKKS